MKGYLTVLISLAICLFISGGALADSVFPASPGEFYILNDSSVVLDRDGFEHKIRYCQDSDDDIYFTLCAGPLGQSPIYKIDKRKVAAIEFDGITTNLSGWSYVGAEIKLLDGRTKRGFIQINFMGDSGYRTFDGLADTGPFQVSWKRIKRIDFTGQWQSLRVIEKPEE